MSGYPVTFRVDGEPVPWAKPHRLKTGGRIMPSRAIDHAARVGMAFDALGRDPVRAPQAMRVAALFYTCRPKSHYGTGRNDAVVKDRYVARAPTGRPDLSNLVKLIEDALTGRAWDDDDQVVSIIARKSYVHRWERAGSVISVGLALPNGALELVDHGSVESVERVRAQLAMPGEAA